MAAVRREDQFLCSICLDLFTAPVSTPCGHNFCRSCLSERWDSSAPCRCPLCNELFHIRPELRVNTLLSEMLSQFKRETGSRSEESKPGEVSCDHCSAPKLKALKSCLVCLSSYCERHLQPHLSALGLKSHQLIEPVDDMEDRTCPQHHKPLELFCRSDHSFLCTMCALLEHQSHTFVSLKEEFEQRKASLQHTQQQSSHMMEQRRQKIQELQSSVQLSERAADREKSTGLQAFSALLESVQRSRERFLQELQDKLTQTQSHAQALLQQLKQEICELQRRSAEAEQLLRSEDHLLFLQRCPAPPPTGLKDWSSVRLEPQTFEGTAARAVSELEHSLKDVISGKCRKIAKRESSQLSNPKLWTVQKFAVDLTLDTDTAQVNLSVSNDLKQVHDTDQKNFPDSPRRFTLANVFTKQSFSSGKVYFEVQVKDKNHWYLGVAEDPVDRKKVKTMTCGHRFWCLHLKTKRYFACTEPLAPLSVKRAPQKVGVFVDCDEGLVSFYDADSADLIYSFTDCCFREKLFPFLNPCYHYFGSNSAPLILS